MDSTSPDIYLASQSPRRRQLLEQISVPFRKLEVSVDESQHEMESPEVFVIRLALEKARAGWKQVEKNSPLPVLGADTAVVLDDSILGKPTTQEQAMDMLRRLSGNTHRVLTGVALVDDREATRLSVNSVTFREIGESEIQRYWETGEPRDKAGGYGIQGCGAVFVEHMEGSYSGVMGLPLFEVADLLDEFAIDFRRRW
ncbi:MAG: septum formation inhibitor Maf [Ectothiorhodospiraceae bacterium]|nr:septum formation inhibitor Maf [Ectothiorhodospiraceae bacterium]MCH8506203.1 Maf-like protein [Ectothiorhodospiraceae bacterium]